MALCFLDPVHLRMPLRQLLQADMMQSLRDWLKIGGWQTAMSRQTRYANN